jgi:mRNA-degrading endonuclease RelE of RelBE toxin-antitoxin system
VYNSVIKVNLQPLVVKLRANPSVIGSQYFAWLGTSSPATTGANETYLLEKPPELARVCGTIMSVKPTNSGPFQALGRRASSVYQVTFSDQSMVELNKLPLEDQLRLVNIISNLTSEQLDNPEGPLSRFNRDGQAFYRIRAGDFRCYFEVKGDTLCSQYIMHKNSLADFLYRNKLPVNEETLAEQHSSFWKYLEGFKDKKD